MKKKFLIISASISLLLACFPFTLSAEEDPQSDLGVAAPSEIPGLDGYFYDNYISLPYVESDGTQYIDTGIKSSSELKINILVSDPVFHDEQFYGFYGAYGTYQFYSRYYTVHDALMFAFNNSTSSIEYDPMSPYRIIDIVQDKNNCYIDGNLVRTYTYNSFLDTDNIYIFAIGRNEAPINNGIFKLYNFSIYDYSADSGNGAYVRYYYPARSKASNTIGLYDAVSKTFFTTGSLTPFEDPQGSDASMSITSKVTMFGLSSLGWIGDILDFAVTSPVIIFFMALGLAGATIRWARRLVHF